MNFALVVLTISSSLLKETRGQLPNVTSWKDGTCPAVLPNTIATCRMECSSDSVCSGSQKCCTNGCGFTCQNPILSGTPVPILPDKAGTCPAITFSTDLASCTTGQCNRDQDCAGQQKCCNTVCGSQCRNPVIVSVSTQPKPGNCPAVNFPIDFTACDQTCRDDNDCGGTQKCCNNGCAYRCHSLNTPTVSVAKPASGTCPEITFPVDFGSCSQNQICQEDRHCRDTEKCCSTGCGKRCLKPVRVAGLPVAVGGVCPAVMYPIDFGACNRECTLDWECGNNRKCCSNGCGTRCLDASIGNNGVTSVATVGFPLAEKAGQCRSLEFSMEGGCATQCATDSSCPGVMKCCRNACANVCVTPQLSADWTIMG